MKKASGIVLCLIAALSFVLVVFTPGAQGQTFSNDSYIIQTKELKQQTYKADQASGNSNKRAVKTKDYEAILGFEDIISEDFFSVSSSASLVDYGKLYPTNPIIRDIAIDIYSGSAHGYSVLTFEDHSLSDLSFQNLIPDTSCDRGLCSRSISAIWRDNLTYGFGYGCENIKNSPCFEFDGPDSFKKFAQEAKSEVYEAVLQGKGGSVDKSKIIYKLNVSASQKNTVYFNNTSYITVPNL